MSDVKTLAVVFTLLSPGPALADLPDGTLPLFATCLGQQSALMEHAWLLGEDGDAARRLRDEYAALLEAAQPADVQTAAFLRDTRIRAKHALARLLQRASLHDDPEQRRRARAQIRLRLRPCDALRLSGGSVRPGNQLATSDA
jgi:hypothetical protein